MKKFSIVIPCSPKHVNSLGKCIGSILDQKDWASKEIVVVFDPYCKDGEKFMKAYPDIKWTYTDKEQAKGAPVARNIGAGMVYGDYLIFQDADMTLYPGALRAYAEAFDDHPDCGFVYAGYKLDDRESYPSEEFDPYFLKINNYIDGNFPMRREVFEPWDPKLKSLQDWDLWLRLVAKGVKGHYMKDQYYFTKINPPAGSISWDSHHNWTERKRTIQKKHNLPIRDVVITSFPSGKHHARRVAKLLDYDYVDPVMLALKPHEYKAVYLIGSFPANEINNIIPFMSLRTDPPTKVEGIKRIRHWIGTDILQMQGIAFGTLKTFVEGLNKDFIHFCQSEENRKELESLGLKVKALPLPVEITKKDIPYPKKFTVGIYDHGQNDIYCQPLMIEVIKAMPDINFVTFGNPYLVGKTAELKNLEFLGHKPIDELIAKTSVLLRITKHDGYPVSPIEFMCAGRPTITNHSFPYMEKVDVLLTDKGSVEAKKIIMRKIRQVKARFPKPAFFDMARKHYTREMNPERIRKEIKGLL